MGYKTDFVINFDWLFKPKNFPKVLEGNYTNKNTQPISSQVSNKVKAYNSMASHDWDFDELEKLQQEHIREKLRKEGRLNG